MAVNTPTQLVLGEDRYGLLRHVRRLDVGHRRRVELAFVDAPREEDAQALVARLRVLNFGSTLNCTHTVLPGMIAQASGRIINLGSTAGLVGDLNLAVYSAMKGAVHSFTKILAKEVGPPGITVNTIAPYATFPEDPARDASTGSRFHPTDGLITQAVATRWDELSTLRSPHGPPTRIGPPSEIGAAAVYLASDAAAFITGQILAIEGGTLIA
jgi:2-hydroxycyclohexanecarboxyl-CoA dehydrogenase